MNIVKTDSADPVGAASPLAYQITAANSGPSDATGVTVVDTLPASVSFASASAGCSHNAGVVTCSIGALAAGASQQFTINVTTGANPGLISNSASISGNQPDPDPLDNTDAESTTINAVADLSVTIVENADPVIAGAGLTYTITVANAGPSAASSVQMVSSLPGAVSFVSATPTQGSCGLASGALNCALGGIASGSSAQVVIQVNVAAGTAGPLVNTASASSNELDTQPLNNTAMVSTAVIRSSDISVTKNDLSDPVSAGSLLTYNLSVANVGPSDAAGVILTDTLPAGVTFVSATPGAQCAHTAGVVTCTFGGLAAGGSKAASITVSVDSSTLGVITNEAAAASAEPDPVAGNNTVTAETTVLASADLAITKVASQEPVVAGETIGYLITVQNNGPSDAVNPAVTDNLPAGLSFLAGSLACTPAAGVLTCSAARLTPGQTVQYTATLQVSASTAGSLLNTASATSDTPDPDPANLDIN